MDAKAEAIKLIDALPDPTGKEVVGIPVDELNETQSKKLLLRIAADFEALDGATRHLRLAGVI